MADAEANEDADTDADADANADALVCLQGVHKVYNAAPVMHGSQGNKW
jgi:hypothetical protein